MSTLSAKERSTFKNSSKTDLRREGKMPAVVYGKDKPNKHIYLNSVDFLKTLKESGRNGILKLQIDGGDTESVMLHDVQTDPLKGEVVHADFYIVNMSSKVDVEVNIHLIGEAQGVKEGGVLQQPLHQVSVRSLPTSIPPKIEIDISHMDIGDVIMVNDIQTDGKYEVLDDANTVIASILQPKLEKEVNTGEVQADGNIEATTENSQETEE
ncbi:50S ribosomal protein L25/general stress protein Ctc [Bacillus sp. Marseille-P3661]|uniref:50S ribosomal protein L25/general stress protein Ctc n=1 Tax=Bacillus sp. Marseille-P3661 TaxID=1936234 RepID=UPI0035B5265B